MQQFFLLFYFCIRVCYAISNCNIANIDVVALYLSERLNNDLYFTLQKLIFSVCIYIFFVRPFFVSQKKNSSNAATREKKANSLIARHFIFIIIFIIIFLSYELYKIVRTSVICCFSRARSINGAAVLASSTPILSLLVFIIAIFFGLEIQISRTCPKSMEGKS